MSDIKTKVQGLDPNIQARDVLGMVKKSQSHNIYEALAVITKRSKQLAVDLKHELSNKLEEFAVSSDTIEEISENKEQIEISKFYERLPNPVLIATKEFLDNDLYYRYKERQKEFED